MLEIADLNTHLYQEVVDTITREKESVVQDAIDAAEIEAESYLERFNTDTLFSAVANDRDKKLLLCLKDMAVWHLLALSNPDTDIDFREKRYHNALDWLLKIKEGKLTPKSWELATEETKNDPFIVASQVKRITNF